MRPFWFFGGDKRSLHLVTTQGRTAGQHLWLHQGTSKVGAETVIDTSVKLGVLARPLVRDHFIEVFLILFCVIFVFFLMPHNFEYNYLLTPWSRVILEKLASLQLVKKFPAFYGTRRFLTALTSARHLSLS